MPWLLVALMNLRSFLPGKPIRCDEENRLFTFDRGDAHPRVTGCRAKHAAFTTLEKAREYMSKNGVVEPKEVIKDGAGETTPILNSGVFYAIAHGKRPGIYKNWEYESPTLYSSYRLLTQCSGPSGSELEVKEAKYACHKKFRTRDQAEAFIEDWKESFADVWRRTIREGLDRGLRPNDMKLSIDGILRKTDGETKGENHLDVVNLDGLTLKEDQ